jgi:hypothetical protein
VWRAECQSFGKNEAQSRDLHMRAVRAYPN